MHPHLRAHLAALFLALLGSTLSADTLTGRVVDVNGVGLPGIDLDAASIASGGNPHLTNDGTDANGFFTATIDPGLYRLTFYAPPPPTTTLLAGVLENVIVSGFKDVGTIVLQPGVSLTGRTLDSAGLPLSGVKVVVKRDDTGATLPLKNATSNAFGNFAVAVPTTALTVELDPTAIALRTLVPARTSATPSGATNLGNLTLLDGFVLNGTVTNLSGVPINGVDLDILDSVTGAKLWTPGDRTTGLGAFNLRVPAGTYDVQFCPSLATRLVAREFRNQVVSTSLNTGAVALAPGVQLSGRVFDVNGTPLSGVDLSVDLSSTGASILTCNDDTNATGNYAVIVPAGTLDVSFAHPGRHGTSAADLHAGFVVAGDTVLDGVLPAPTAFFTGTPLAGAAPLPVQFLDLSTGAVTSWSWTFGDGATSTDASPSHTYTTPGTYTVALTETGPGGTSIRTRTDYVVVLHPAPVAAFAADVQRGKGWLPVRFTDLSSGPITGWSWNFGDGTGSTLQAPLHLYRRPGVYTVTLTVSGPGGVDLETRTGFVVVNGPSASGAPTGTASRRIP